ncbi:hypothetical protein PCANC_04831 [Puccinia coronata f. sp. avenae]|uniref:Uncharacterized protein n=1 Tax=Puccinia coronata f. sp. avenae TaxID=200324 RepID=A0A2N5W2P6_9BASI|nr:hypothetical protein PCANC_04831 [Puccinia coronata f. sp. avenae]
MDIRFGDWILVGLQGKRGNTLWVDVYISPTSKSFWSSSPQQSHPRIQTSKSQFQLLLRCFVLLQRLCFSQQEMNGGREPKALMISLMILTQSERMANIFANGLGGDCRQYFILF